MKRARVFYLGLCIGLGRASTSPTPCLDDSNKVPKPMSKPAEMTSTAVYFGATRSDQFRAGTLSAVIAEGLAPKGLQKLLRYLKNQKHPLRADKINSPYLLRTLHEIVMEAHGLELADYPSVIALSLQLLPTLRDDQPLPRKTLVLLRANGSRIGITTAQLVTLVDMLRIEPGTLAWLCRDLVRVSQEHPRYGAKEICERLIRSARQAIGIISEENPETLMRRLEPSESPVHLDPIFLLQKTLGAFKPEAQNLNSGQILAPTTTIRGAHSAKILDNFEGQTPKWISLPDSVKGQTTEVFGFENEDYIVILRTRIKLPNGRVDHFESPVEQNPDGTRVVNLRKKENKGGSLIVSKKKKSTLLPKGWNDEICLEAANWISRLPPIEGPRADGTTSHVGYFRGIQWQVFYHPTEGITSVFPTGGHFVRMSSIGPP